MKWRTAFTGALPAALGSRATIRIRLPRLALTAGLAGLVGLVGLAGLTAPAVASATTPAASASSVSHVYNHDGLCLGISSGLKDVPAVQWRCLNHPDQEWTERYANPVYFQLVNQDGQCLGVAGGSTSKGARVYGWSCLGLRHPDQYWAWGQINGNPVLINYAASRAHNWNLYVLGVAGGSRQVGAVLVIWPATGAVDQIWHMP